MKPGDLLTSDDVADYTGLNRNTITGYKARHQMPKPDKQYGRTPLWRRSTIDAWRTRVTGSGEPTER